MSQQHHHRQHHDQIQPPAPPADAPDAGAAARAQQRAELARAYAAADAILDHIRQDDPERFLNDVRQSGGQ